MLNLLIALVAAIFVICLWVLLYDSNRFVVVSCRIEDPAVRAPYRAVLLTDLHNKRYGRDNERLIQAIRLRQPDAVWTAGDILTARPRASLEPALRLMEALSREYPVCYGNGNHEQRLKLYPGTYGDMAERYDRALEKMGIRPLVNTHVDLPENGITVYGLEPDRRFYRRFKRPVMEKGYLEELLGKPLPGRCRVLLAHDPEHFKAYAAWGADVVLSGHVHGGVIRIPFGKGLISPSLRLFPKYDGGLFQEGESRMILSRGLGMHTVPLRLFNPGELIVLDFLPGKERAVTAQTEKGRENAPREGQASRGRSKDHGHTGKAGSV